MSMITEILDAWSGADNVRVIPRQEDLLLQSPPESAMKMWRDYAPLTVTHFPLHYIPAKFAPPRDISGGKGLRLEWQQMNARQPFYHRNSDVDEMSYQVSGDRPLMTELGIVELSPGDFSRIPVVAEVGQVTVQSEVKKDGPFPGWEKATPAAIEMMTECLGAKGCDVAVSMIDEDILLHHAPSSAGNNNKLFVQRAAAAAITGDEPQDPEWVYKSAKIWVGNVKLSKATGKVYNRHHRADAIHCQTKGTRMLVTQRGLVKLQPGDFISIPKGCAYTSLCKYYSEHLVILTSEDAPMESEISKEAKIVPLEEIEAMRKEIYWCNIVHFQISEQHAKSSIPRVEN
ncbi:hypothetical protein BKA67DRAFT_692833 [Truncatella angustata]|uniref:Uncharacterized protein n=1 Tax=Truncatella angustata TaxID=152316 RepID=A0A9P8ZW28_9PEZI|nr:uncharacterized protein BKA67DRAFT_692833 [Truncatella angustata]KAH6651543.1 hypothetical protein BKA67DRAFT_692833 [Truncatella angustata]